MGVGDNGRSNSLVFMIEANVLPIELSIIDYTIMVMVISNNLHCALY